MCTNLRPNKLMRDIARQRLGRFGLLFTSLAVLMGMVISDAPLIEESILVTPFATGRYEVERRSEGAWSKQGVAEGTISGGYYEGTGLSGKLGLTPIDERYFAGMVLVSGMAAYGILEAKDGRILVYFPLCGALKKVLPPNEPQPETKSDWPLLFCRFDRKERLFAALVAFAKANEPEIRLTPVFDRQEIPAEEAQKKQPAFLKLCNESFAPAAAILFHRHFYEAEKAILEGWFTVQAHECKKFGPFPIGDGAIYAKSTDGTLEWKGAAGSYCVTLRRTERVVREKEECIEGEARKGFRPLNLSAGENSYVLSGPK